MKQIATTTILLLIAFFAAPILLSCDLFEHKTDNTTIAKLEARIANMEEKMQSLESYNKVLKEDNERLLAEKEALRKDRNDIAERLVVVNEENSELRGHVTSLNFEIEMKRPKKFTIKFNNGELYNKAASRDVAARVVNLIKHYGSDKTRVTIKGYSSHDGPADLNMKLSKERAEGVMHKIYEAYDNGPLNIDVVAFGEGSDDERKVVVEFEVFK